MKRRAFLHQNAHLRNRMLIENEIETKTTEASNKSIEKKMNQLNALLFKFNVPESSFDVPI